MKHIASSGIGIALALGLVVLPAGAQNQASQNQASQNQASQNQAAQNQGSTKQASPNSQSSSSDSALGDYARQIRKAPAAEAKTKAFDNDNLPRDDKLSIVGNATETPAASATDATAAAATAAATGETKAQTEAAPIANSVTNPEKKQEEDEAAKQAAWKQWGEKIAAQKDQIDLLSRELDVLEREYKLRAAAMYADVGNRLRNSGDWDKQDAQYKQQIADKQKAVDDAKQKLDDMMEDARKAGVPASIREP